MDESGFEANTYRPYAWSKRGQKSYGERSGKRGKHAANPGEAALRDYAL